MEEIRVMSAAAGSLQNEGVCVCERERERFREREDTVSLCIV